MTLSEFEFEEGDEVLIRVRENGTSGNIVAKLTGICTSINEGTIPMGSPTARFELPWGFMNSITLRPYDAEFEKQ